ncbi:hypothetical protein QMK19_03345 [Streptomyces sp. H10-C2]|uniref:hypothetical protein n=1 Tax=unclassified Streptomyces TaxID=2593676 RepID=UPI0024BBA417|nr:MULTISPECIES: hypothetical protein [unclassified Streptomyces]MDJ0342221.1 hypothetical protein [Streptomyces sp. PH10-H1]MDJ0368735.1 hypothetical protein [Streptomyces sp. H10-C2]
MSYPEYLTAEETLAKAKTGLGLPPIVVLCGSTRFMDEFADANLRLTARGRIVLSVGCNMKVEHELWADPEDAEILKVQLDILHRRKILLADEVLVVGDYVGQSTRGEIDYARSLGKPIRFTDAGLAADFDGEVQA